MHSNKTDKVAKLTIEIEKLRKKCIRHRKLAAELDKQLRKLRGQQNVELIRQHVGGVVEVISGDMDHMSQWLHIRGTVKSVGRTLAKVDFGDRPGRYHGVWDWPIDWLEPIANAEVTAEQ